MSKYQMKSDLKELANKIRNGKSGRKPKNLTSKNIDDFNQLYRNRYNFRHMHIAYCLMRGTPIFLIENPSDNNLHNSSLVDKFMEDYK